MLLVGPPVITGNLRSKTVTALKTVKFTCSAKGFKLKYKWRRHNSSSVIGKQSTLTISEATPSDSDQYYCVAMTEGGYAFSNNVTLTVNGEDSNHFNVCD